MALVVTGELFFTVFPLLRVMQRHGGQHRVNAINEEYQRYMERVRSQAQGAIDKANQQYEHSMGVLTASIDTYLHFLQQRQVVPAPVRTLEMCCCWCVKTRCTRGSVKCVFHMCCQQEDGQAGAEGAEEGPEAGAEGNDGATEVGAAADGEGAAKEAALAAEQALLQRHTSQPANLPLTWLNEEARAQVITAYESQQAPGEGVALDEAPAAEGAAAEVPAAPAVEMAPEAPDVAMEDAPGDALAEVHEEAAVAPEPAPEPSTSLMALLTEDD